MVRHCQEGDAKRHPREGGNQSALGTPLAKPPRNPEADFAPVTKLVNQAMVLVVNDKAKYGTVAQILAAAKASPA